MSEMENLLGKIDQMLSENRKALENSIESKITMVNNNLDSKFEIVNNKMDMLAKENEALKAEMSQQKLRLDDLEKKRSEINTERNMNIILYGVRGEYYSTVLMKIITILQGIDINLSKYCIKGMLKIGKKRWNEEGPIRVTFISHILRNDVLRNKFKLKNKNSGIMIREDLSEQDRETRKLLSKFSLDAKEKGQKVHMRNNKLVIEGKMWTLEELEKHNSNDDEFEIMDGENSDGMDTQEINNPQMLENDKGKGKRLFSGSPPYTQEKIHTPIAKKGKQDKKMGESSQQTIRDMWRTAANSAQKNPPPMPMPPLISSATPKQSISQNDTSADCNIKK